VYYAFTDWDGLDPDFSFIGLRNFADMLDDPDALQAVWHTMVIAVAITVIQNGVGLLLALGVNTMIRTRNVLRVLLFAPAVITPIVTAYLWRNLLGPDGAVNSLLGAVGLASWQQDWLGDPQLALWMIVLVIVWQFAGYSMVIFLAGLQSIPREIYEAAAIDGTGPVRRFWFIVRPLLAPAITINLMLSIIGGIKLFDQVYALTGGGPGHATDTISTLIYKDAFTLGEFGYSIALAVVLTAIVAIASATQYAVLSRNERAAS
jgi:raffinose/stachyose/melibiose transport system permease protein